MHGDYYRPQWDQRVVQPAPPPPGGSWYEGITVGHGFCFALGMIVGMILMRWQHGQGK